MERHSPLNLSRQEGLKSLNDGTGDSYPDLDESETSLKQGVQELIGNLDHQLLDVRLRALKCLLEKVEYGIISTKYLSRRFDLLNRLSDWVRAVASDFESRKSKSKSKSTPTAPASSVPEERISTIRNPSSEGIPSVIQLLTYLVQHEPVVQFILEEKLDSSLGILRLQFGSETRTLVDTLLDLLQEKTFDFQHEGLPENWYDNASSQLQKERSSSTLNDPRSSREIEDDPNEPPTKVPVTDRNQNIHNIQIMETPSDTYFPQQSTASSANKVWASSSGCNFGIPVVQLGPSDRKVLSSTIESVLSKNDKLMSVTTSFVRDALLQDYPAEVFIQESSLCMALLEIAENSLNEASLQLAAVQCLLKLSEKLRYKLVQINRSDHFETKSPPPTASSSMRNNYYNDSHSSPYSFPANVKTSSSTTNNTFVDIICQILKSLSRTLLFQPGDFNLWKLMDSFALTLCKCASIVPVDTKNLTLGLQEVLLDLSYCYEKNYENVNSPALALCLTSILKSIHLCDDTYILPSNVRQCLRKLLTCPRMNCWVDVNKYVLKNTSAIDNIQSLSEDFDSQTQYGREEQKEPPPNETVCKLLVSVQNATSHESVLQAVDSLWSYLLPLEINTRLSDEVGDIDVDRVCKDAPWRDAFYRFLCVEPTCVEDETLLIKVVELLNFLITHMNEGRKQLESWIVPLCMEKGCASLRILNENSLKLNTGVVLPNLLRTMFDFYFTLMRKSLGGVDSEFIWDLFTAFCLVLNELGDRGFSTPVILHPLLNGISRLTTEPSIKAHLLQNPKLCIALTHRVIEAIIYLQDQSGGLTNESYRNQGVLYYASLSLCHLTLLLVQNSSSPSVTVTNDWIGKTCAVIPCLWESKDFRTRSLGYQLCELLTRQRDGVLAVMTILESPITVWTSSYNALMDPEEPGVVKYRSASVLLNLLQSWEELQHDKNFSKVLQLPNWAILDDFTKLLAHVYWLPSLSEVFRVNEEGENMYGEASEDISSNTQLVTPKVLITVCKILKKIKTTTIHQFHPEPFVASVISSGVCPLLFRLIGTHTVTSTLERSWWMDSLVALSSIVETLIILCNLDRSISVMLIGDKRSLTALIQLLALKPHQGQPQSETDEMLATLWVNIFFLLHILCVDSGNNFEDFERCIRTQRNLIFTRLIDWLKQDTQASCRKAGLSFSQTLFSKMMRKQQEKEAAGHLNSNVEYAHPLLCQEWADKDKDKQYAYGSLLCESLMNVYDDSINTEEKLRILRNFRGLINLSPSTKSFAIEHDLIGLLMDKLKSFSVKYYDSINTIPMGKKSLSQWQEEIIEIVEVLSGMTYGNLEAKKSASLNGMIDTFHKIFRLWKSYPDRTMLHGFIETLLNFTDGYPPGCQALTMSTSVLGVGPRKAPGQQSFLAEILDILQFEINENENINNFPTIELIFELLKNVMYVLECRNVLIKTQILGFLTKLHVRETRKWGPKLNRIKIMYLKFLFQITIHPDMQAAVAKVPESVEIFLLMVDLETDESSLLALKILKNLCFLPANRPKFLCDDGVLTTLSAKIRDSDDTEEIQTATVGLWALIANSEKGKLLAKKSLCHINVAKALTRVRKMEHSSNDLLTEKKDLTKLVQTLSTVSNILGPNVSASAVFGASAASL